MDPEKELDILYKKWLDQAGYHSVSSQIKKYFKNKRVEMYTEVMTIVTNTRYDVYQEMEKDERLVNNIDDAIDLFEDLLKKKLSQLRTK